MSLSVTPFFEFIAKDPAEQRREAGEAAAFIEPSESTVQAEKISSDIDREACL